MRTLGAVLVVIGIVYLVAHGWTAGTDDVALRSWPIVIGVAFLALGLAVGGEAGPGLAAVGGMAAVAGVILAIQRETGAYTSWTYAWPLVAPGGVGLGIGLYGLLARRWSLEREGAGIVVVAIALSLVFLVLFEGVIDVAGLPEQEQVWAFGPPVILALGAVLVLAGIVLPHLGPSRTDDPVVSSLDATVEAVEGDETAAFGLGAASTADVAITFGAGRLVITGPAAPGQLADGTFHGGVRADDRRLGVLRLSTPAERLWSLPFVVPPFDWRLGLTAEVPLRLALDVGAARAEADLSSLRVSELRVKTGAADSRVVLPARAGFTRVTAEGGASAVDFVAPSGVAVRVTSTMALGSTIVDEGRFPRDPLGGWTSPDFGTAANRIEIDLRGGVGSFSVH
jgi:hypothetical protein